METWIIDEGKRHVNIQETLQWKMIFHGDLPQQWDLSLGLNKHGKPILNGTECGVYLIMTGDFLNDGLELDRNSKIWLIFGPKSSMTSLGEP